MSHPVTRWQIVTPDPARHAAFYAEAFGWSVDAQNPLGYRQVAPQAGGIGGGFWPAPAGVAAFVQLYVEVEDVQAHVDRASALGARVLVPPQVLPEGDELAILHDPHGVAFGIYRAPRERS
jgi:predicted enzyme related to lactoylglutathione lyase